MDTPPARPEGAPPADLPPAGCRRHGSGKTARLEIDWYDPSAYILAGMGAVFTVPLGGWFYLGRSIGHPAWYAFGGVFGLFVGFMFYGAAVKLKDRTTVFLEGETLKSTIGPLPFPGGTAVPVADLTKIGIWRVTGSRSRGPGGPVGGSPGARAGGGGRIGGSRRGAPAVPHYDVYGVGETSGTQALVTGLATPEKAAWVATQLGEMLGVNEVATEAVAR